VTLVRTLSVSSADLLALDTTPLVIVPAAGVDSYNCPEMISVFYQAGGTAYTLGSSPTWLYIGFMPNPLTNAFGRVDISTINTTNDQIESNGQIDMQSLASDGLGTALGIQLNDGVTLGDGTLFVTCHYVIV